MDSSNSGNHLKKTIISHNFGKCLSKKYILCIFNMTSNLIWVFKNYEIKIRFNNSKVGSNYNIYLK